MRVLIAEDDVGLRSVLERGLRENGYVVDAVADGEWALRFLRTYDYEVAILDWRMPSTSGLEVVRELRRLGSQLPVLMLTARDAPSDRVKGLDEGADDYLVKPFAFEELLARIRALQRRSPALQSPRLTLGDLEFNPATREALVDGRNPGLTSTELSILEILMRRSPAVVERRAVALHVWAEEADALGSNTIDVHMARLRGKLGSGRTRIETIRGYRIQDRSDVTARTAGLRSNWTHAARVAAISTLLIASVYVLVSVVFDVVDSHHLVAQVDAHLRDRLHDVATRGDLSRAPAEADDDRDVDVAPVLLWHVDRTGHAVALSDTAPRLPRDAWAKDGQPLTSSIGTISFRVIATPVSGGWLVAAQSLSDTAHVRGVLIVGEAIAGPVVVLAMFFGALIIGLNASRPVEQARRRQLEFTADASHELRTPLSVIEAEVTLTLSAPRDAARYRDTVERVNGESKRLRRIIEDLLWLARFDSEPAPPRDELVDVFAVAQGCADRFGALARSRGIALSVEHLGDADPLITAPPEWIDRLTGVLVDNACRYAGEDGTVRVSVSAFGNRTTVIVEDSGPGIPPEERPLLFDRFHRATDDGSGTGLGLAIADSIVRSTGGRWRVTDGTLGGAHFEVSWHRAHLRDTGPGVLTGRPAPKRGSENEKRVLSDRSLGGDSNP